MAHLSASTVPLFQAAASSPYWAWRSFFCSALLHCAAILALPSLVDLLPDSGQRLPRFVIRPLELHLDEILYLPADSPDPGREAAPKPPRRRTEVEPSRQESAKVNPRRFELPDLARKVDAEQTILQPQYPPGLPLEQQVRLPNIVFWSTARLPRPEPKRFVAPGRPAEAEPSLPNLAAPPRLEMPNREPSVSDLKIAGAAFSANPALPRPRGTTMPVRVFSAPVRSSPGGTSMDAVVGEPINVIAFSTNPGLPQSVLVIPAGNQLGRLPGPPPAESESEGPGAGGAGSGSVGGGAGSGSGGGGRQGTGGLGAGGSGSGAGQADTLAALLPPVSGPAPVPVRVVHPNTAVVDIVIHSLASGVLLNPAVLLKGKPIYTVYLELATKRDWILQYCKAAGGEHGGRQIGSVVQLGTPAPVKAPYLMVRATPPITLEPSDSHILVHGFLDTHGRLKDLSMVRDSDLPLKQEILPYLEKWEFRPGTQDGRPVALEILLVIPPNEG